MIKFFKLTGLIILLATVVSVSNIYAKTKVSNTAKEVNKDLIVQYQKYAKNIPTFLSSSDQLRLGFIIDSSINKLSHRSATSTKSYMDAGEGLLTQKMNALDMISRSMSIPGNDSIVVSSSTLSELVFATSSKGFQYVYKKVLTSIRQEVSVKSRANMKQASTTQIKLNKAIAKVNTGRSNRVSNVIVKKTVVLKNEAQLVATTTRIVATTTPEISTSTPIIEIDNNSTSTEATTTDIASTTTDIISSTTDPVVNQ